MDIILTDKRYNRGLTSKGNLARINKLFNETAQNRPIVYGSIGGSITEGATASPIEKCYAARFAKWLDKNSASGCKFVNAGIGASDSMFGTFRAKKDLLSHEPDIITIEYAVNDSGNSEIELTYESLIRQCLSQKNNPAVILIFTMNKNGTNKQVEHIKVGKHYDLPMLSYRDALYPDIESGQLKWEDTSPDAVHPNNTGHKFMAEMLQRLVAEAIKECPDNLNNQLPQHLNSESKKFVGGNVVDAELLKVISNQGWEKGHHKGGYLGFQSNTPGAEIVFEFICRTGYIGYQKYAGDFGRVEIILDDNKPVILEGFFEKPAIQAWAGGHTVFEKIVDESLLETHKLTIRLLHENHSESNGYKFDIGYLLLSNGA